MDKGKAYPVRDLGQGLMRKSLELAREDPVMAVRLANLGVRISTFLQGGYDPLADPGKRKGGRRRGRRETAGKRTKRDLSSP